MRRFVGALQLLMSLLSLMIAIATLVNMTLIASGPGSVSVVNTIIGQSILILFFLSLATVMFKKGRSRIQGHSVKG